MCRYFIVEPMELWPKSFMIYNLQGRLIRKIAVYDKATTIDISDLASGMYFVKAKTESGIVVKKFVKE